MAVLPPTMFEPVEADDETNVEDMPHYRCEHMVDAAFEEYALLAYDCNMDTAVWDVPACKPRKPMLHDCQWGAKVKIEPDGSSSLDRRFTCYYGDVPKE